MQTTQIYQRWRREFAWISLVCGLMLVVFRLVGMGWDDGLTIVIGLWATVGFIEYVLLRSDALEGEE